MKRKNWRRNLNYETFRVQTSKSLCDLVQAAVCLKKNFFAVPNGGYRSAAEASIMNGEGVTAGVADTLLLVPRKEHHGMCIEFKVGKNDLTPHQQEFKKQMEKYGYKYVVCRSFDEFEREVNYYLAQP
jgi:hypothetical protein